MKLTIWAAYFVMCLSVGWIVGVEMMLRRDRKAVDLFYAAGELKGSQRIAAVVATLCALWVVFGG